MPPLVETVSMTEPDAPAASVSVAPAPAPPIAAPPAPATHAPPRSVLLGDAGLYRKLATFVVVGLVVGLALAFVGVYDSFFGARGTTLLRFEDTLGFALVGIAVLGVGLAWLLLTLRSSLATLSGEVEEARAKTAQDPQASGRLRALEARAAALAQQLEAQRHEVEKTRVENQATFQRVRGSHKELAERVGHLSQREGKDRTAAQDMLRGELGPLKAELERVHAEIRAEAARLAEAQAQREAAAAEERKRLEETLASERKAVEEAVNDVKRSRAANLATLERRVTAVRSEAEGRVGTLKSELERQAAELRAQRDALDAMRAGLEQDRANFAAQMQRDIAVSKSQIREELSATLTTAFSKSRFYTMLGVVLLLGLVAVGVAAYFGVQSPGVLTSGGAFAVIGLSIIVVAITLLVLILSLSDAVGSLRKAFS